MSLSSSGIKVLAAETPIKTSAFGITSAKFLAALGATAKWRLLSCRSAREVSSTPDLSTMVILLAPINLSNLAQEQPAAPAPKNTIFAVLSVLPCISKALVNAAATITAVPC